MRLQGRQTHVKQTVGRNLPGFETRSGASLRFDIVGFSTYFAGFQPATDMEPLRGSPVSVVDVVRVLTDSTNPADYVKKMRRRDAELSEGWGQIVTPLSLDTPGGKQNVNCADIEGILRIIYLFAVGARRDFEKRIGHSIISPRKAIDNTVSAELLPFNESEEKSDFFEEKV